MIEDLKADNKVLREAQARAQARDYTARNDANKVRALEAAGIRLTPVHVPYLMGPPYYTATAPQSSTEKMALEQGHKATQRLVDLTQNIRVALGLDDDVDDVERLFQDAADLNRRIEKEADQELAWSVVNGVPVEIEDEDNEGDTDA